MKLKIKDLFVGRQMVAEVWALDLAPKLFMKLRRLDKAIGDELKLFEPERIKFFQGYLQFFKDGVFSPPKPDDEVFPEYVKKYDELFGMEVEIAWENEDVAPIEKKIEESKSDVHGSNAKALLDLLEQLNQTNDLQKVEPVAPAGV